MTEFPEYDSLTPDRRSVFDAMYEAAHAALVKSLGGDGPVVVSSARRMTAWNFMQRMKSEEDAAHEAAEREWEEENPFRPYARSEAGCPW